jgi:2-aminomuconate deaminase
VAVYVVDIGRDFATFNRLYAEAFPDPTTRPTRTTVEVSRLPGPIAVELKVIATI